MTLLVKFLYENGANLAFVEHVLNDGWTWFNFELHSEVLITFLFIGSRIFYLVGSIGYLLDRSKPKKQENVTGVTFSVAPPTQYTLPHLL